MGLGKQLAHNPGGFSRIHEIVDEQVTFAVSLHPLQHLDVLPDLGGATLGGARIAGDADRVDQPDVELARHECCRDQAASGYGDDALPGPLSMELFGQEPRVAVQFDPGNNDLVLVV